MSIQNSYGKFRIKETGKRLNHKTSKYCLILLSLSIKMFLNIQSSTHYVKFWKFQNDFICKLHKIS
jgi:hypothetical protein